MFRGDDNQYIKQIQTEYFHELKNKLYYNCKQKLVSENESFNDTVVYRALSTDNIKPSLFSEYFEVIAAYYRYLLVIANSYDHQRYFNFYMKNNNYEK